MVKRRKKIIMGKKRKKLDQKHTVDNIKTKLESAFSISNTIVYKRDMEVDKIKEFLQSKKQILNIVGVPGSGKTSIVFSVCKNYENFKYFNFYNQKNIKTEILKNNYSIVVIDEFDKFYQFKQQDSKLIIHHITSKGGKLITLGNNLEFEGETIIFKPYSSTEIEEIVKLKIDTEIGIKIISDLDLKLICRKNNNGGDMRCIFRFILDNFESETNTVKIIKEEENIVNNIKEEDSEESLHHKLIRKVGKQSGNKLQAFKKYFSECEDYNIIPLSRLMFFDLFDVLWYN